MTAMIAQIVEQYGKYNSSRGVVFELSGAQGDGAGRAGRQGLLAGLLAPYGDDATPTRRRL